MAKTIKDCLGAAAADGSLSQEAAEEYQRRLDELTEDAIEGQGLGRHDAQVRAAERLQREIERRIRRRKRMRVKQALIQDNINDRAKAAKVGERELALSAVFDFDPQFRYVGENVAMRTNQVRSAAFAEISDFIDKFRSRNAGLTQQTAGLNDVIRGLFGEKTTPEAKALADAISTANNRLVGRFNLAGGDIVRRQDWGWIQAHDAARITAVRQDEWVEFVAERIDPSRMLNADGEPMTARELGRALMATYERITTGDLDALAGIFDEAFTSPVNARIAHREIIFRDSRAWIEYQQRFGNADLFGAITGHLERMSRDVAVMEILGPYPRASLEQMKRIISADREAAGLKGTDFRFFEALFEQVTGEANQPYRERFASVMQANRNLTTGSLLGGAVFASLGDTGTVLANAKMNGMDASKVIAAWARQLNPADPADRKLAARAGLVAETWIGRSVAAQRFMNEVTGPGWTNTVTDTALRLSGLNAWTDGGRAAYGLELIGHMTDEAAKPFSEVQPQLRAMLERHGITPEQWELYRSTAIWKDEATGAELIRPEDIWIETRDMQNLPQGEEAARREAANRFGEMLHAEINFAIITPTARTRAAVAQAGRPGTIFGEIARSAALFKSFPLTMTYMMYSRVVAMQGLRDRVSYLATVAIGMTLAGAVAEQASSVFRGKDPLDMTTGEFWGSAVARGGALGALGDFLYAGFGGTNRHGNTLLEALAGPILGAQLGNATAVLRNFQELLSEGEARNPGADLVRFARGLTPGQSLWYARAGIERLIFDNIEEAIDGRNARDRFRRVERHARKEFEQNFWWRPGRITPERPIDLSTVAGS